MLIYLTHKNKIKKVLLYLIYIILIVCLFKALYRGAVLSIDAHHDGTMFNPALKIAEGGVMYKDTSTYYGVLTVYIQAFFLVLFGKTLLSLRISAVVFYVFCFIAFFNIFKKFIPRLMVLLTEAILLCIAAFWMTTFHAWSSIYSLFFILCYMYFGIRFAETNRLIYIFLVGVSTTLVFWTRTPCGIVFILVSLFMLLILHLFYKNNSISVKNIILTWCAGFLISILPFFIVMVVQGTISLWWDQCIWNPIYSTFLKHRENAEIVATLSDKPNLLLTNQTNMWKKIPLPYNIKQIINCLFPVDNSGIYIILPFASLYIFFNGVWQLFKTKKHEFGEESMKKLLLAVFIALCSLGSWHQYFGVSDVRHWYWAGFPMVGVLAYMIYELFEKHNKGWRIAVSFIALTVLSITTLYERHYNYEIRKERYSEEISEEICPILKGIKLSKEQREFYEDYCTIMEELAEKYPNRRFENRSFSRLLASIDNNDRDTIDDTKLPIIICNSKEEPEGKTTHYLAIEIEQHYPEQELDSYQWTVRFYLPKE